MLMIFGFIVTLLAAAMPLAADPPPRERDGVEVEYERDAAEEEVAFGIEVAQRKLWNEAVYRFERATRLDPTYAAAFNNLAVAYEQTGKFADARKMYERARALDPDDIHIELNYELFNEIDTRRHRPE